MNTEQPIKVKHCSDYIRQHLSFTGCLIDKSNAISWYENGKLHGKNGPAVEFADGSKWWFKTDRRHRENGPAVEQANGDKAWWLDGRVYSEQAHRLAMRQMKLKLLDKILE